MYRINRNRWRLQKWKISKCTDCTWIMKYVKFKSHFQITESWKFGKGWKLRRNWNENHRNISMVQTLHTGHNSMFSEFKVHKITQITKTFSSYSTWSTHSTRRSQIAKGKFPRCKVRTRITNDKRENFQDSNFIHTWITENTGLTKYKLLSRITD